jgi:hypothetical protein
MNLETRKMLDKASRALAAAHRRLGGRWTRRAEALEWVSPCEADSHQAG